MKNITKDETKKIWSKPSIQIVYVSSTKGGVEVDLPEDDFNGSVSVW